jgi:hypothetical protein
MEAYLQSCQSELSEPDYLNARGVRWGHPYHFQPNHGFRLRYDSYKTNLPQRTGIVVANAVLDQNGMILVDVLMYEHPHCTD